MNRSSIRLNAQTKDVLVSGGGLVGSAMVAALQQLRRKLAARESGLALGLANLMMVDAGKKPVYDPANVMHQLRTCSITPVSSKILENLQCWNSLTTKHAFYRMSVRHESTNSPFLPSGGGASKTESGSLLEFVDLNTPVGFVCFNTEMHASMVSAVEKEAGAVADTCANLPVEDTLLFEKQCENIKLPNFDEMDGQLGTTTISGGEEVQFRLMLGCEGRGSQLREIIQSPSVQHDYSQTAFVCTVRLGKLYDGNVSSFQNFFNDGKIIAMLPTSDETSNIIFSTTPQHAKELLQLSQENLVQELNNRLHAFAPSDIPKILEVPEAGEGKRAQGCFPLRLTVATRPYSARAICLGDAAHGIHPFAGQGLNLGIYDLCALTEVLEEALTSGQDVGSCIAVGQKFAGEMLAHTLPIISGMECIKFLCHNMPSLATFGMKLINTLPVLSPAVKNALLFAGSGAPFANRHPKSFLLK